MADWLEIVGDRTGEGVTERLKALKGDYGTVTTITMQTLTDIVTEELGRAFLESEWFADLAVRISEDIKKKAEERDYTWFRFTD